mmetsp:Transcript_10059/g.18238  ORF Transcript_10059/g.18238 Transcript_10059/m.18238 type:complete len:235 (-) Transcript_10059:970-1674(-)
MAALFSSASMVCPLLVICCPDTLSRNWNLLAASETPASPPNSAFSDSNSDSNLLTSPLMKLMRPLTSCLAVARFLAAPLVGVLGTVLAPDRPPNDRLFSSGVLGLVLALSPSSSVWLFLLLIAACFLMASSSMACFCRSLKCERASATFSQHLFSVTSSSWWKGVYCLSALSSCSMDLLMVLAAALSIFFRLNLFTIWQTPSRLPSSFKMGMQRMLLVLNPVFLSMAGLKRSSL